MKGDLPENIIIGAGVIVHPLASVGTTPFEFVMIDGRHRGFPRCGGVILKDDVEIFPYANVDCGFLGMTILGQGTKIDHHVQVGHNSIVGENCLITAHAVLAGHLTIGDGVFVGVGATIRPRVTIGDGAFIGMGATITEDVPAGMKVRPAHCFRDDRQNVT